MQCPRCGFDQPDGDECLACGIVIAKYLASVAEAAAAEGEAHGSHEPGARWPTATMQTAAAPGEAPASPATDFDRPAVMDIGPHVRLQRAAEGDEAPRSRRVYLPVQGGETPIGRGAAIVRGVAAVACLALAVLMVLNGSGLASVWPFVIMVFYGACAIWGLTTLRTTVTIGQFGTEMAVLVVVTLLLRAASPAMFSIDTEDSRPTMDLRPRLPDSPLGRFTSRTLDFLRAGQEALAATHPIPAARWAEIERDVSFEDVRRHYAAMADEEKARAYDIWKRLGDVGPLLEGAVTRYKQPTEGGVRLAVPPAEQRALGSEVRESLARAEQLRARILVFPADELAAER